MGSPVDSVVGFGAPPSSFNPAPKQPRGSTAQRPTLQGGAGTKAQLSPAQIATIQSSLAWLWSAHHKMPNNLAQQKAAAVARFTANEGNVAITNDANSRLLDINAAQQGIGAITARIKSQQAVLNAAQTQSSAGAGLYSPYSYGGRDL